MQFQPSIPPSFLRKEPGRKKPSIIYMFSLSLARPDRAGSTCTGTATKQGTEPHRWVIRGNGTAWKSRSLKRCIQAEQRNARELGKVFWTSSLVLYDKAMRQRGFAARMTSDPEIQRLLHFSLKKMGKTFSDFLALGQEKLLQFWESIPTIHVEMTLESERDEQRSRDIQLNDVIDVSFLSVAIPYCDIVITERFWVDLAKRNHLDQRYGTILLTNFADLEFYLSIDA